MTGIERLRACRYDRSLITRELLNDAANEIDRLMSDNAELLRENLSLRSQLAAANVALRDFQHMKGRVK